MKPQRDEIRGMFASRLKKYELTTGKSGDFFTRKAKSSTQSLSSIAEKEYPVPARSSPRTNTLLTPLITGMKVEPGAAP